MIKPEVQLNQSCRRVFGRCYLTKEDFVQCILKHQNAIRDYAFALHDKDTYDEDTDSHKKGDLKVPHIHFCIILQYPIKAKYVANWFVSENSVNNSCMPMRDTVASFEYLTHKNNPEKYQYPDSVIVCSNFSAFMPDKQFSTGDTLQQALLDMLAGNSLSILVSRYGRDFIIHYTRIKELYNDMVNEKRR